MAGREKVNGGIKKIKPREKWVCWELSREDIESTARRVGINPGSLREINYNNIARKFEEQLKKVNKQQWEVIMEDAIEREVGRYQCLWE